MSTTVIEQGRGLALSVVDPRALRNAFGRFMSGVVIVAAERENSSAPVGFTANSFSSVSISPPLLSVCPGNFLSSFETFRDCARFAVSILADDQQPVAELFAKFKGDRFARVDWHRGKALGVPLITGAAAGFECRTHQVVPAGDHIILIGEIVQVYDHSLAGLGYHNGDFFVRG